MKTSSFYSKRSKDGKNHRRICPINNDLPPVDTLGTPLNCLFTGRSS